MKIRKDTRKLVAGSAAHQKGRKRQGILLSLFSLVNRLVVMTMLVVLLRWWLQRKDEEKLPEQASRENEIALDRYEQSRGMEQPQTAPVQAPISSGYEANWPEPETALSQAETAPVEGQAEPENTGAPEMTGVPGGTQAETAPDDFTRIEGVGPKISSILLSAGFHTFRQLADTEASRIEGILQDSGLRLANPATWPEQARLLADGDLEGLRQLQSQLKAGRRS